MANVLDLKTALEKGVVVAPGGAPTELPAEGIGKPELRHDGQAKVTGEALYAGEDTPRNALHAVFVGATIPSGRVTAIKADAALAHPGVVRVLTHADMPEFGEPAVPPFAQSIVPMGTDTIAYEGQPVAMVLAETLEQAEEGAALVELEFEVADFDVFDGVDPRSPEQNGYMFLPTDIEEGDVDVALSNASAIVEETYDAPSHHHNMMEPHTTLAHWDGDKLHIHDATQWTYGIRYALAGIAGIDPSNVTVVCPYTGGGFGCKGYVWPHQILVPVAARIVGRPVKLSLGRAGCYTGCGYQPHVKSHMRLGADANGKLVALEHRTENVTSVTNDYIEYGSAASRSTYAVPNYRFQTLIRPAHVGTPTPMRAPHEGPGIFGTESAMDELAYKLGVDPLEFRLRNYAEQDLLTGKPFSSKKLREAYEEGARRFGWADRKLEPRSHQENGKLIGMGVATGIMTTFRHLSFARIALEANGDVVIEAGTQEIGTGVRTVLPQIAAEKLGIPVARVRIELGSTDLTETAGTFGSGTSIGTGSAIANASEILLERIKELSGESAAPAYDTWPDLLAAKGVQRLTADGTYGPPEGAFFDAHGDLSDHAMYSYGAVFVEVEVDEDLGTARMRRAVGCYSAGRILNPVMARSQMIGGIIWGYGRAMLEVSPMDPDYGRYLSKNLSGVMVPVNADIPQDIDVSFIDEYDPHCSTIGVRGIGELGECGVAPAVTNAIYHACGKRVRDLPVRLHHLVG